MKIGDIDGKGTIYNEYGKAIIRYGEYVVDIIPAILKSWIADYHRNPKEVFLTGTHGIHFEGEFTVTDKRIILLAEPRNFNPRLYTLGIYGSAIGNFQYVMKRSNLAKERNGKLYLEIEFHDIENIVVGIFNSFVYLRLANGKKFRFVFDKESGNRLKETKSKMFV